MICWQISLGAILEADYHILSKSGKKHWQRKTSVFCVYYKVSHRRILKIIHILALTCSSSPPQPFCFSGSDITTCSWSSFLHSVPLLNSGKTGRQPVLLPQLCWEKDCGRSCPRTIQRDGVGTEWSGLRDTCTMTDACLCIEKPSQYSKVIILQLK